jgi:hypothetical protein
VKASHGRLEFVMPAPSTKVNHDVRLRWDTLLDVTYVEGGGTHPYVGATRRRFKAMADYLRARE